jgi:hypothetical protein
MSYHPYLEDQPDTLKHLHDPLAAEQALAFDYDEIDRRLGNQVKDEAESASDIANALRRILAWIVAINIESAGVEQELYKRTIAAASLLKLDGLDELQASIEKGRRRRIGGPKTANGLPLEKS